MWGAHMSQTKRVNMLDSIGVHICKLLTIDDTPSSKPTQQALKTDCTDVGFASFFTGGFITATVVNPLER